MTVLTVPAFDKCCHHIVWNRWSETIGSCLLPRCELGVSASQCAHDHRERGCTRVGLAATPLADPAGAASLGHHVCGCCRPDLGGEGRLVDGGYYIT